LGGESDGDCFSGARRLEGFKGNLRLGEKGNVVDA
jgi:hypothetical protein